jgi:type IV pilus assembly protein PilN
MIRTNLATRPFYNARAAQALLAAFALLVVFLTVFNVYRVVTLSSRNTALSVDIRRDEETAARLRADAARVRGRINEQELKQVMAGAREANALIDRRTFSWTEFFNLIERTLPENVMLTSVSPSIDEGRTIVNMTVMGRQAEDIDAFMEQLEATNSFRAVQPRSEDVTEEGLHRVALSAEYIAPHTQAAPGNAQ